MAADEIVDSWAPELVPPDSLHLYKMLWQLETWLRTMVYVELRADRVDWEEPIKQRVDKWPPRSLTSDKELHHMATPHQAALSYLTLGQLWSVISDAAYWPLFEPYFPPKSNTETRFEEVQAIRRRIAHFREPHHSDITRLTLFMQDMEQGIRRFCDRYCTGRNLKDTVDPVSEHLDGLWEQLGYGIELHRPDNKWLYAPGPTRNNPQVHARLEVLVHSKHTKGSARGLIYKLSLHNARRGIFDIVSFVGSSRTAQKDIIHIRMTGPTFDPVVTIPAVHGVEATAHIVAGFAGVCLSLESEYAARSPAPFRSQWAEHILWPSHMLTFFDPGMREPVLDLTKPA